MTNRHTSKVSVELGKNRLVIVLTGTVGKKDLESLYTEIRFCVADLNPGFVVINDLSRCHLGYLGGLGTFSKIREYLSSKGASTVARIAPKRNLSSEQLSRVVDLKTKYEVVYVPSMEEAEERLTECELPLPEALPA